MDLKVQNFRYHYKECERSVQKYINHLEGSDIIDIGSNVGFFSEAITKNINYKSIHLFEPCKEYYDYSLSLLGNHKNIYFNNYGLSDCNNNLNLYKSPTSNIGWNTFLLKDPNQNINFVNSMIKEECIVKILDDYIIDNVDFIKIDVEGYEHKVINGAMDLIIKFNPYILIEVGWGTNHPEWDECYKTYNKLFDIGYQKVNFTNKTEDILFIPLNKKM